MESQPLRHDHYPASKEEYEAELTETENEYAAQLQAVEDKVQGQAARYLLFGAISVVINITLFYLFYHTFGIEYQLANFIDWVISVQCSFWLDRTFVFKHKSDKPMREMGTFYMTRIATFLLETVILFLGISWLNANGTMTKVIGHAIALVLNFFLSKKLVFKNQPAPAD
ncbi:MAG: GtrA family protein [Levilactobacillus sp.]|jgi:putative flippase GtrA|uniref:GtrA family protein n=1 Tax=Levilactobacillus sp. TaxID=2767919 RepID=UPI00258BC6AF|nr:GtrA family protein [Levilactobacillus sp.]MCI1553649.1 GtrA family protein [Levilactobacillus sp.]MCI1598602.1 GtrA family protein [Levilactobacillus sp.]MCI1605250.1 GtrA family protein [Levilactobacillus sp.]